MLTDLPEAIAAHAINRHWLTRIDTGLYWGRPVTDHPGMEGVEPWPQEEAEILVLHPDRPPVTDAAGAEGEDLEPGQDTEEPGALPELGYGVADSVEQVLAAYPGLVTDPRCFAVAFQRVSRDEEPPEDHPHRWAWRTWGEYIGEHHPQRAQLADEPVIEEVVTFEVYEIAPVATG